jgi:hypothetical protein
VVFEVDRFEARRLLVHYMLGEIGHVLCDFDVLDVVKILLLRAGFTGLAQERADECLLERFECNDVLAFVSTAV